MAAECQIRLLIINGLRAWKCSTSVPSISSRSPAESTAPPLFMKITRRCILGHSLQVILWYGRGLCRCSGSTLEGLFPFMCPSACVSCSASCIDKHRFNAPGCARLSHYSKCQLCKWSTARFSSHISCVIALMYLFWCGIHASIAAFSVTSEFDHLKHGV